MSGGINIHIPKLYFSCLLTPPKELLSLSLSVLPCTVIAFIESLGRVSVYTGMLKRDKIEYGKKLPSNAISMHAADNLITSAIGMMPNAIYAENLAIMNLHAADLSTRSAALEDEDPFVEKCYHSYSVYPYVIASIISIIVACFGGLQNLFISIPKPILGGMEMFVFALIAAPGIQMLVEQQVNYKRISNQIITASVLLAGISNVSISYGTFTLKGMSLGLTIGVAVNVVTIVLDYLGFLNERFTVTEIIEACFHAFTGNVAVTVYQGLVDTPIIQKRFGANEYRKVLYTKENFSLLQDASKIAFCEDNKRTIVITQDQGKLYLSVNLANKYRRRLQNDYPHISLVKQDNRAFVVTIDEFISKALLSDIISNAQ